MKPLLKLFVVFCLVSFALSRPFPEGDEEDTDENSKEETEGDGEESEDAEGDDSGGEKEDDGEDAENDGKEEEEEGEDEGGDDAKEGEEEEGDDAKEGDDDKGGDEGGEDEEESSPESGGGKGEGKDDRAGTYQKVVDQLEKETKVDHIQSEYLKRALDNDLQAALRNPVVEAIGTVGDYSKISSCFKSMGKDVKKVLDAETKSFEACKSKKDSSEHQCSEESSQKAEEKLKQIGTKITSCVSSKGHK